MIFPNVGVEINKCPLQRIFNEPAFQGAPDSNIEARLY